MISSNFFQFNQSRYIFKNIFNTLTSSNFITVSFYIENYYDNESNKRSYEWPISTYKLTPHPTLRIAKAFKKIDMLHVDEVKKRLELSYRMVQM